MVHVVHVALFMLQIDAATTRLQDGIYQMIDQMILSFASWLYQNLVCRGLQMTFVPFRHTVPMPDCWTAPQWVVFLAFFQFHNGSQQIQSDPQIHGHLEYLFAHFSWFIYAERSQFFQNSSIWEYWKPLCYLDLLKLLSFWSIAVYCGTILSRDLCVYCEL